MESLTPILKNIVDVLVSGSIAYALYRVWGGLPITRMNRLIDYCGKWASKTFDKATPASIVEHLRREVAELAENPADAEEAADCMLLLFHLAYKQQWDMESETWAKLKKNMGRTWGKPDAQGVVEHVD